VHSSTKRMVRRILGDRKFKVCVDLGCGNGDAGEVLKPHCKILIGVDHNLGRLSVAKKFGGYDKVVYADVREYEIPPETDAVFLFDIIEHLPKSDGIALLQKLRRISYVMLTTPSKFFPLATDGHVTLWTRQELEQNGFTVIEYSYGFPTEILTYLIYGKHLLAVRELF